MRILLSYFHPKMPIFLVYMLQQVEYDSSKFIGWLLRLPDLTKVNYRQELVWTAKAKLLVLFHYLVLLLLLLSLFIIVKTNSLAYLAFILTIPFIAIGIFIFFITVAWNFIEKPRRETQIKRSEKIFSSHKGLKIAVTGSYGKTTMKELLYTVLSEGKKVAKTPGNKNVPISHARFASTLSGDEDVVLVEYGEAEPGDILNFAKNTHPDLGVITGLAPNHLDGYKTFEAVAEDLFSLKNYLKNNSLYVNTDSEVVKPYIKQGLITYSQDGVDGWKITGIKIDINETSFVMQKGKNLIKVKSGLLGRHQVGPLALTVSLAHKFGLTNKQIETGLNKTTPFEHRMQARDIGGGHIIDDTYNGSLEGINAGLEFLKALKAKRKIYVTPGLVDQGDETERVHVEIGAAIAKANPNKVVLMKNSTTGYIEEGIMAGGYEGSIEVRDDPLNFYSNIEHYIAAGDIWLLQNDWTDNYS
ncbi:MAG: Mur ligase family protein [Candidatus Saccharimonadales bacterium]